MKWSLIAQLIQQLLPVAIKAVEVVENETGAGHEAAVKEVIDHLTPGAPNSTTLGS